jgi:phosphoribosylglycinamide formyltransferase-1
VAHVTTLGVLVSGEGTNLQAILDAIGAGTLDARVGVVISNVPGAGALLRARAANVDALVLEHGAFRDRRAFDAALVEELRSRGVEIVVLAGFMRLITEVLLDAFPWRIVNVHPALLPAFPGVHAQKQALDYGVRIAGCTVHLVDRGTDTGPIIAQAAVPILEGDDEASLRDRILVQEHELLPRVLQWMAEGRVAVAASAAPGERARVHVRAARTCFGVE